MVEVSYTYIPEPDVPPACRKVKVKPRTVPGNSKSSPRMSGNSEQTWLTNKNEKLYDNFIYGSIEEQETILKVYCDILQIRDDIKTTQIEESTPSLEGPFAHVPNLGH